jgi:peptidoglycan hydrolase-like protein with peptidoglycan-binding domain
MARTLFGRGARGGLIVDLQTGLMARGLPLAKADGDFGARTETAVRAYQAQVGAAETGVVNTDEWVALTGKPVPTLAERCLQITSAFEGHGYTKAAGNWDGAWLTWGLIGFTMKFGRVQEIIRAVERGAPQCIQAAFGADAPALLQGIGGTEAGQQAWASSISAPGGHKLLEPWQTAFARFGEFPEVQAAQRQCALDNYFTPAVRAATSLGLTTELGIALLFDIHVQNGGVAKKVREALPPLGSGQTERSRRELIANGVADNSLPEFRENVRRRKLAFATGAGMANGVNVVLASWGLEDVTATVG